MAIFQISGGVINRQTHCGIPGLRIEAWDKDLICDDLVGSALTDEQGHFQIEFDESYFQELFFDRQPDLFFKVFDKKRLIKSTEDSVLWNLRKGETQVVIEVDTTSQRLERERQQFRTLILSNPNYFGNVKDSPFQPVLNIQSNTTYEEIGCVGFQPQFNRLEAVVFIKRPFGYGGSICSDGTPEYVRFYLSFDEGVTWVDQGLTSFTAYDIPDDTTAAQRLEYDVSLQIKPPKKFCFIRNLVLVRAILSWNAPPPPNAPDFSPVWGNVHDTHVQIEPLKLIVLADVFKELEIKTPPTLSALVDLTQPLAAPQPKALSAVELKALYKDKNVQPHRFALTEVKQLLNQPILSQSLMAPGSTGFLSELDINLAELIEQLSGDGDTSYEQLECVGLNPNQDTLAGIIRVKLSSGYSGGPCTAGSREYVTFWADFNNNGTFETYLGTTSVNVYDIDHIPEAGLEYAVFLPVDLNPYRQPCEDGPKVVRIRAILSWQDPPPSNNPNFIPIWGNREETLIHIKPGPAIPPGVQVPLLSAVGDISVPDINSSGLATGVGNFTGFVANNSPFGGKINLAGKIVNGTSASKYRVMRKPHGATDSAYVPLTNEPDGLVLTLITFNGGLTINTHYTIHADAEGYYTYQDYASNHYIESNILMRWFSTALEDGNAYDLRLDLSVDGNPAHDIHSNVVTVLIDNTAPDVALDIDLGTGVECADFNLGASFTGSYKVVDSHFGSFSFVIRPVGPAHGVLPVPPSGAYPSIADPGVPFGTYTLNTTGMAPCGYSLTLQAWDRTNVNSGSGNNYNEVSVGFCLLDLKPKPSV